MRLSDKQLKAINLLIAGQSQPEISAEIGVSRATLDRWKVKFAGIFAAHDEAVKASLIESRVVSAQILLEALDELRALMKSSDDPMIKLSAIDRVFRAHQILNPPVLPGSVTVTPAEESNAQVIISLPDNCRGSKS